MNFSHNCSINKPVPGNIIINFFAQWKSTVQNIKAFPGIFQKKEQKIQFQMLVVEIIKIIYNKNMCLNNIII